MMRTTTFLVICAAFLIRSPTAFAADVPDPDGKLDPWTLFFQAAGEEDPEDERSRARLVASLVRSNSHLFGEDGRDVLNGIKDPMDRMTLIVAVKIAMSRTPGMRVDDQFDWESIRGEGPVSEEGLHLPAAWPEAWRSRLAAYLHKVAADRERFMDGKTETGGLWIPHMVIYPSDPAHHAFFSGGMETLTAEERETARKAVRNAGDDDFRTILLGLPPQRPERLSVLLPSAFSRLVAEEQLVIEVVRTSAMERLEKLRQEKEQEAKEKLKKRREAEDEQDGADKKADLAPQGDEAELCRAYLMTAGCPYPEHPEYLLTARRALDIYEKYLEDHPEEDHVPWVAQRIRHLYGCWTWAKVVPPGLALTPREVEAKETASSRVVYKGLRGRIDGDVLLNLSNRDDLIDAHRRLSAVIDGTVPLEWWSVRPFDENFRIMRDETGREVGEIDPWLAKHLPEETKDGYGWVWRYAWHPRPRHYTEREMERINRDRDPAEMLRWVETRLFWSLRRSSRISDEHIAYFQGFRPLRNALHWVLADARNGAYGREVDHRLP